jgi:hypothetical protein
MGCTPKKGVQRTHSQPRAQRHSEHSTDRSALPFLACARDRRSGHDFGIGSFRMVAFSFHASTLLSRYRVPRLVSHLSLSPLVGLTCPETPSWRLCPSTFLQRFAMTERPIVRNRSSGSDPCLEFYGETLHVYRDDIRAWHLEAAAPWLRSFVMVHRTDLSSPVMHYSTVMTTSRGCAVGRLFWVNGACKPFCSFHCITVTTIGFVSLLVRMFSFDACRR